MPTQEELSPCGRLAHRDRRQASSHMLTACIQGACGVDRATIASTPPPRGKVPYTRPDDWPKRLAINPSLTAAFPASSNNLACNATAISSVSCRARYWISWVSINADFSCSTCRANCLSPCPSPNSLNNASSTPGSLDKARSTSRHCTLPEPSQVEFTGASRYRRGKMLSSTYPAPPMHSAASLIMAGARLQIQYLPTAVTSRANLASCESSR